ncbi:MAG: iron ABC transporter permease, partial [Burkholderiales bacterium PBB5]
ETASGLWQALHHGRLWLATAGLALAACAAGVSLAPGRTQGVLLSAGAGGGLLCLLVCGFAIGLQGWSMPALQAAFGPLVIGQFGIGLGGAAVLLSLTVLLGAGLARLGYFRGDVFVAAAVVLSAALLALFVALPVAKALVGALQDEAGQWSAGALADRLSHERIWGLACLAGGVRCGVAWNTLLLALLTAGGTTVLGTLIALLAERGPKRLARPLNGLALLPIITPPFVVGLGLILLFGRAGVVNQWLEAGFGIVPTRWFYGLPGVWLAQLFAFTPIAFMI